MLPDGQTVIGRDGSDRKRLVMEDIVLQEVSEIGKHGGYICTVLYHDETRSLLVGDHTGHVIQYQKSEKTNSFTKVKDHGNVGIGPVISSCQYKDYAVFGGYNTSSVAVINIPEQKLVQGTIKTAFKNVDSLQICEVSGSKVLLSVGGRVVSYSDNTDVFEVEVSKKYTQKTTQKETKILQTPVIETQSNQPLVNTPVNQPPLAHHQSVPYEMVETLISNLPRYVEGLFRHFCTVYARQLGLMCKKEYT